MKRLSYSARCQQAHKAQENPYGAVIVFFLFVIVLLLSARTSFASGQFTTIDAYARACPAAAKTNLDVLASYLRKSTRTDLEKSRSIYVWLAANISYDAKAYNAGVYPDQSAEAVLKTKKSVCAGFANLYTALGQRMGLNIKTISGYAKTYSHKDGERFGEASHAWNAILIDEQWRYFDATWGEGYGEINCYGKLESTKSFNEEWFNVAPEYFVFSHFAENPLDNHLPSKISISLRQFEILQRYSPAQLAKFEKNPYSMLLAVKGVKN